MGFLKQIGNFSERSAKILFLHSKKVFDPLNFQKTGIMIRKIYESLLIIFK